MNSYKKTQWMMIMTTLSAAAALCVPELVPCPIPPIPSAPTGLSGTFAGSHNGALIVAGGTNFPEAPPWRGGKKIWHNDIYVLTKNADHSYRWIKKKQKLSRPAAYGVSISLPQGVLCIGGCDADRSFKEVFLLRWNPDLQNIEIIEYPSLPEPLAYATGAVVGRKICIAGGIDSGKDTGPAHSFYILDTRHPEQGWQKKTSWPGSPRMLAMSAGLSGQNSGFFLFGGCVLGENGLTEFLQDACRYDLSEDRWHPLPDLPGPLAGGTALASASEYVFIFGGDEGSLARERQRIAMQIAELGKVNQMGPVARLEKELIECFEKHPGFRNEILAFNPASCEWETQTVETPIPVTTTAVWFDGKITIPGGETRPGLRTPEIRAWTLNLNR